jgi:hypothetical protein
VFQRGNQLVRLRLRYDTAAPVLEPLTGHALRGLLTRAADWYLLRETKEGPVAEPAPPPLAVVQDLLALPKWVGMPLLEMVMECPTFSRSGELIATPGYHWGAQVLYQPSQDLALPPIPTRPTGEDIERAQALLLYELLGDFPFADAASRVHALAALLLPFVRQMIDGPTPLFLIDAPTEGTGKTLLTQCLSLVATGHPVEAMAEAVGGEEWRKRLTALLTEAPPYILLDNLNRVLDSAALASLLTTRLWRDRRLGSNTRTVILPNTAVWLASGNNLRLSRELMRRAVWCRLDANVDCPWRRTGFRHPHLLRWAQDHRRDLVWASLVLCRAWIARQYQAIPPGSYPPR